MNTPANKTLDLYFGDARSKLLDIAAFMDRMERSGDNKDYRYEAFESALSLLDSSNRTEAILKALSDPTTTPVSKAPPGPATGAWKG